MENSYGFSITDDMSGLTGGGCGNFGGGVLNALNGSGAGLFCVLFVGRTPPIPTDGPAIPDAPAGEPLLALLLVMYLAGLLLLGLLFIGGPPPVPPIPTAGPGIPDAPAGDPLLALFLFMYLAGLLLLGWLFIGGPPPPAGPGIPEAPAGGPALLAPLLLLFMYLLWLTSRGNWNLYGWKFGEL